MNKEERKKKLNPTLLSVVKQKKAVKHFEEWIVTKDTIIAAAINAGMYEPLIFFFESETPFSVEIFRDTDEVVDKILLGEKYNIEVFKNNTLVWESKLNYASYRAAATDAIKVLFKEYNSHLNGVNRDITTGTK